MVALVICSDNIASVFVVVCVGSSQERKTMSETTVCVIGIFICWCVIVWLSVWVVIIRNGVNWSKWWFYLFAPLLVLLPMRWLRKLNSPKNNSQ
jgi:hypothetical protein